MTSRYRPEIDGLRCIAVVGVLLFHAGLGFSGGFTGVDVFFVISGFLIGGNIDRGLREGTFSLFEFWFRRIRRILPSSLAVGGVTLALAYLLMLPEDYAELAKSLIAQLCMVSNFFFADAGDYFGSKSESWPLLHTWSLSVEEQFYIAFPFVLWWFTGNWRRRLMVLGAIASFALSVLMLRYYPHHAFYLLPSRAWQLLVGALAYELFGQSELAARRSRLLTAVGSCMVALPMLMLSKDLPFPGWAAVPSTLGTAFLLIGLRDHQGWTHRILASRLPVCIGKVSYSLYLWHWPPLAFANYFYPSGLPNSVRFLALLIGIGLTILAYFLVEKPLRLRGPMTRAWPTLAATAVAICFLAVTAWFVTHQEGIPNRFAGFVEQVESKSELPHHVQTRHANEIQIETIPRIGIQDAGIQADFLVWGDSHIYPLVQVFDQLARDKGMSGIVCVRNATMPILDTWRPGYRGNAKEAVAWNNAVRELTRISGVRKVFLVCRWDVAVFGRPNGEQDTLIAPSDQYSVDVDGSVSTLRKGLVSSVHDLNNDGVEVVLVAQPPTLHWHPQRVAAVNALVSSAPVSDLSVEVINEMERNEVIRVLNSIGGKSVTVLMPDVSSYLSADQSRMLSFQAGAPFYVDTNHLTSLGANRLYNTQIMRELSKTSKHNSVASQVLGE